MDKLKPCWQLPMPNETTASANRYIPASAKYHYFVDGKSLCKRYGQDTDECEVGVEDKVVLQNSNIACKKCYKAWNKRAGEDK